MLDSHVTWRFPQFVSVRIIGYGEVWEESILGFLFEVMIKLFIKNRQCSKFAWLSNGQANVRGRPFTSGMRHKIWQIADELVSRGGFIVDVILAHKLTISELIVASMDFTRCCGAYKVNICLIILIILPTQAQIRSDPPDASTTIDTPHFIAQCANV